jgi:hypothetical protein
MSSTHRVFRHVCYEQNGLKSRRGQPRGASTPSRLMGHNLIGRTARYAHLSSAQLDAAVERLEGRVGLFAAFACKERGLSHSFTASGLG